jgi:biopolymer transport protein ExbB/TolQ
MPQILTIIIKGGIVMIPLLACSLISLALSIERILFWTRRHISSLSFTQPTGLTWPDKR